MASKTLLLVCLVALLRPLWGVPLPVQDEPDSKAEEDTAEDFPEMYDEVEEDWDEPEADERDYDKYDDAPIDDEEFDDEPEEFDEVPEADDVPDDIYRDQQYEDYEQ
ncbi:hypothetical protein OS493_014057 [Desmophyllum pertusum]|uniref:Uncharacterized protein n=1 Tax=Desmophyllum pertusum TaxID=174260 RepID=A0A9W9ZFG4_9CNID|nr:hypothetical protein OS493_014057 [Desmophyllum pertusum]